jgi:hypothetical protein
LEARTKRPATRLDPALPGSMQKPPIGARATALFVRYRKMRISAYKPR